MVDLLVENLVEKKVVRLVDQKVELMVGQLEGS